jgi:hypothetical protein
MEPIVNLHIKYGANIYQVGISDTKDIGPAYVNGLKMALDNHRKVAGRWPELIGVGCSWNDALGQPQQLLVDLPVKSVAKFIVTNSAGKREAVRVSILHRLLEQGYMVEVGPGDELGVQLAYPVAMVESIIQSVNKKVS